MSDPLIRPVRIVEAFTGIIRASLFRGTIRVDPAIPGEEFLAGEVTSPTHISKPKMDENSSLYVQIIGMRNWAV